MSLSTLLARCVPETVGVSSAGLTAFIEAVEANQLGLHSFMLLRHGKVAAEAWWSPYSQERKHMAFSISKSFTSTAVGLAINEGLLTIEDRVVSFFPDKEVIGHAYLQEMRVKHLLTMTAGHAKDTMDTVFQRQDGDWIQAMLDVPVEYEPGTHFVYNSGASYMLSAILDRLTGQSVHGYLQSRLFEPLGITGTSWQACPRGISCGGWGLDLKTEDIARFGQLYLQNGVWDGEQIIPAAWVEAATSYQVSNGNEGGIDGRQGYGYQFWRCQNGAYRAAGAFGQYCIVMPEQNAVLAITSGTKNMQKVLDMVWEHLLPAMAEGEWPTNEREYQKYTNAIASLSYPPLSSAYISPLAQQVSGQRYELEDNERNLRFTRIHFREDACEITVWGKQGEMKILCGMGNWLEGVMPDQGTIIPILASGKWESENTFIMNWRFVESPFIDVLTCTFDEDRVSIRIEFLRGSAVLLGKKAE